MEKVIVSWSSGKDSALSLYDVMHNQDYEVIGLLTTINHSTNRVSMHHVHREFVERQAASIGLPLEVVCFDPTDVDKDYETAMRKALERYQRQGVNKVVSGDINLEDLRKNREDNLSKIGLEGIFPLWKRNTRELAETIVQKGFKAVVTSVDNNVLSRDYLGQVIDNQFLVDLPVKVDPCGENGEYHSFVFDGPIFQTPIRYTLGEIPSREGRYWYCDLISEDT